MADINPSTETARAMLTETLGRLRKASEEYFGLLEKGLSSSPLPIADQAKQFCDFMQRNVTATFDLGDKLSQAKDMQEALKISVRVLPGTNADDDRAGQGYGRVRHEGSDRSLYPKELNQVVSHGVRGGPMPVRSGSLRSPARLSPAAASAIGYSFTHRTATVVQMDPARLSSPVEAVIVVPPEAKPTSVRALPPDRGSRCEAQRNR